MCIEQALEKVQHEIIDSGRDVRYHINAYSFVLRGLDFYCTKIGQRRHVSGSDLSAGLAEFAHAQFGPLAYDVLVKWGIFATNDFGYLVYNMIEIGLMSRTPQDSLNDFFAVFDIKTYLENQEQFSIDRKSVSSINEA